MEQLICYRDFGLQSTSLNGFFFAFYVIVNCVLAAAAAALFSIERMAALAEWWAGACPFAYCSR